MRGGRARGSKQFCADWDLWCLELFLFYLVYLRLGLTKGSFPQAEVVILSFKTSGPSTLPKSKFNCIIIMANHFKRKVSDPLTVYAAEAGSFILGLTGSLNLGHLRKVEGQLATFGKLLL